MSQPDTGDVDPMPEQQLSPLEELWNSLAAAPDAVPITAARREKLDRRLDELDSEGPVGISWDEALDQARRHRR
jgi:putative addiction module component (TIGR02574 family)